MSGAKKVGRPVGSKTSDPDLVDTVATRCKVCGCTDRAPYYETTRIDGEGLAPDGRPYTRVVLRKTKCEGCQQHRIDRWYECEGVPL